MQFSKTNQLKFNKVDQEKVRHLIEIRWKNNEVQKLLSEYLTETPCFITSDMMEQMKLQEHSIKQNRLPESNGFMEERIYCSLLISFFGLEPDRHSLDRNLVNEYFRPCIKKKVITNWSNDPYYCNISIPEVHFGNWQLTYSHYIPYEAFIYNDIIVKEDFREIPCLGFFSEDFKFPVVMEKEHEWMAIKPNEIETMKPALSLVKGNVITFGLGLGYFAYKASLKSQVEYLTIIERDPQVIELFERYILPQFPNKSKIEIIHCDAFDYLKNEMLMKNYDYAFFDLWHDVSDGVELYLELKKWEHKFTSTQFLYWIEESLRSGVRWRLFDTIVHQATSYDEIIEGLSNAQNQYTV